MVTFNANCLHSSRHPRKKHIHELHWHFEFASDIFCTCNASLMDLYKSQNRKMECRTCKSLDLLL